MSNMGSHEWAPWYNNADQGETFHLNQALEHLALGLFLCPILGDETNE